MRSRPLALTLLGLFAVASVGLGLAVGAADIPIQQVFRWLLLPSEREVESGMARIVLDMRLPRVLAAGLSGACLAVAGAVLQALLRNPLADPYVLGVSAGGSVGAAIVVLLGLAGALAGMAIPLAAVCGALLAALLVFGLARGGDRVPGTVLLLSGVVVASVLGSLVSVLLFLSGSENRMQAIVLWTMGGFSESDWNRVALLFPLALLGMVLLWAAGRDLNLLAFGEDPARFLGADVGRLKTYVLFVSSTLTGIAVAMGGVIGFVGIIVPHAVRRLVGPDHRWLLPACALGGCGFLILADAAARVLRPPMEVPVGLLTGLLGGPFFLFLMRSRMGGKA